MLNMSKTTPKERRQQRTRDAILSAAVEIIREKGAEKLSLREIARRIDYSPAGLYEYFGSKDEIIQAICLQGNERLSQYLGSVDDSLPFEEYIFELAQQYIQFAVQDRDYFLLMFSRLIPNEPEGTEEEFLDYVPDQSDGTYFVYQAIKQAIADDVIDMGSNLPIMYITIGFWGIVHGLAMLRITHLQDYPINFEAIEHHAVATFLRGLRKSN